MKFIAIKTDDGTIKGKLAFYCRMLHVSRQGFYKYLSVKDRPWKYQTLADTMLEIHAEDVCNDTYGRVRMFQALTLKRPDGIPIPSERTVYRVMTLPKQAKFFCYLILPHVLYYFLIFAFLLTLLIQVIF